MKFVLLLAFVGLSAAQEPKACLSPPQWEARRLVVDRSKQYNQLAQHTYDEIEMRTYSKEEVSIGTERDYYEILRLHKEGKEYRLNLKTNKCNVTTLTEPFRPIGIPPNGHFQGTFELGPASLPNEHITVEAWNGTFPDGTAFEITITVPDCVPVNAAFYNKAEFGLATENYFDMNLGISRPEVFIPRSECLQ